METKITKLSADSDQQLQQQLDQCQQEYEQKLQDVKVRLSPDRLSCTYALQEHQVFFYLISFLFVFLIL